MTIFLKDAAVSGNSLIEVQAAENACGAAYLWRSGRRAHPDPLVVHNWVVCRSGKPALDKIC